MLAPHSWQTIGAALRLPNSDLRFPPLCTLHSMRAWCLVREDWNTGILEYWNTGDWEWVCRCVGEQSAVNSWWFDAIPGNQARSTHPHSNTPSPHSFVPSVPFVARICGVRGSDASNGNEERRTKNRPEFWQIRLRVQARTPPFQHAAFVRVGIGVVRRNGLFAQPVQHQAVG